MATNYKVLVTSAGLPQSEYNNELGMTGEVGIVNEAPGSSQLYDVGAAETGQFLYLSNDPEQVKTQVRYFADANNDGIADGAAIYVGAVGGFTLQDLLNTGGVHFLAGFDDSNLGFPDNDFNDIFVDIDITPITPTPEFDPRTPGFWSNNGAVFWEGDASNNPKAGKADFPTGDLVVSGNTQGAPAYILIGDWDGDGTSAGEGAGNTIKILVSDAQQMVSGGGGSDGRMQLMRDLTANWLNKLAGSDTSVVDDYMNEAIDWLYQFAPTLLADGQLTYAELTGSAAIAPNSAAWKKGFDGADAGTSISTDVYSSDILAGSLLHQYLDYYNNTGSIF